MAQRLFILPGFSIKNKDWALQISDELSPQFEANIWNWKHWETGDKADFSVKKEVSSIITQLESYNDQQMCVLAKSIGTYVLAKILQQSPHSFAKIILCGIPLNDLEKHEWNVYESLKQISAPALSFQNDRDPHGNFAQVSNFFKNEGIEIPVIKKIADNHNYCYSEEFKSFLSA